MYQKRIILGEKIFFPTLCTSLFAVREWLYRWWGQMVRRILPTFVSTVLVRLQFSVRTVGMGGVMVPRETYGYESI
jgi:hypothetical protein